MNTENTPKLRLTEKEAAPYVGLKPITLRTYRMRNQGPAYLRIGRAIRYDLRDLDKWLASKRVETE